ncbi:Rbm44 [Columba guinea]|nr:Rbm44 [Columba guinea]
MESEKKSDVTSKRRCFNQTSHTYSEKTEHMLVRNAAAGTNHSGFGQAHSAKVSELKFSEDSLPYLNSSLDADIEIYNKQRMRICCARVDENKEEADTLGRACDNTHFNCGVCDDCRQSHLDEDSQLEYLSAHEQDFDDGNSSSKFSEQRRTIGIETLKLTDPVHEVPEGGVTTEQNLVDMSEDCSSEYGVGDPTCLEAATPELPHLLQASLSLQDSSGMTSDHQEEQTEYHSVVCGSILESHSYRSKEAICPNLLVCDSLENEEVKDTPLIGGRLLPQITTSEEVLEKNDRHSQHLNEARQSLTLATGKGPCSSRSHAEAVQFCKCGEDSDFYSCEESVVCARGTSYTVMDAETQLPVSAVLTSKNPFFGVEAADESLCGNTSCLNLVCCETLKKVASDSTVNQAVDVSSDFRACFTTSRSTSAQVCLSSRAINTEITMMNKSRPAEWCRESCADVACNTDWSCGACSTEEICSQLTGTVEKHSDGNTATAEISLLQDNPQLVCLTDASQPSESTSSKTFEGQHKDQDVECAHRNLIFIHMTYHVVNFNTLKFISNVKGCLKNEEGNEYWFDAKEDLTVPDFSVISEETEKQQEKQDMVDVRETKKIESGNECFICIGGLSSSVSEGDLRSHFQKYQISDILMCVDSGNYRYMNLSFTCFRYYCCQKANKAKLAVEEMNEKKIKGKTISVEFVKHSSLVSQILTNKLWPEIQPVDSSQRKDQDKTLTSASNAVKAPYAISAAEKTQLLPITPSKISCSTRVPSEAKCPHLKSSSEDSVHYLIGVNQKDTGENFLQKTSAPFSTNSYEAFIPLNTLNLSSFTKLMKKLQEMHPEASRDKIVDALLEVKKNNKGILSGLPISTIRERTSAILRKSTPSCGPEIELYPKVTASIRAHHFIAATACQEADYGWMIRHYCLKQFQLSMEGIGQRLWCDWDETVGDKIERKKREWKDHDEPHVVLKNVQDCCCCFSSLLPLGSLRDLSPSINTYGDSIQM